jgi:hypothetical protein
VTAVKFRIWYAAWLFPWIVLDIHARTSLYAATWFLMLTQLSVILYGHIRVAWLGDSHPTAILIGVPLIFLGPLLLGFAARRFQQGFAASRARFPDTAM